MHIRTHAPLHTQIHTRKLQIFLLLHSSSPLFLPCAQLVLEAKSFGKYLDPPVAIFEAVSGADRLSQITAQIVVGTPGTVKNLLQFKRLDPSKITLLVLDEADTMVAMQGMGEETVKVKNFLKQGHQVICMSATFSDDEARLSRKVACSGRG